MPGFADLDRLVDGAVLEHLGDDAVWTPAGVAVGKPVRVLVEDREQAIGLPGTGMRRVERISACRLSVAAAEAAFPGRRPAVDDVLLLNGEERVIAAAPMREGDYRSWWLLTLD